MRSSLKIQLLFDICPGGSNSAHTDLIGKVMAAQEGSTGGCLCGTIQYRIAGTPQRTIVCHCDNCQRVTGSAFMVNAWFKEKVRISNSRSKHVPLTRKAGSHYHSRPESTGDLRRFENRFTRHPQPFVLRPMWVAYVPTQSVSRRTGDDCDRDGNNQ